MNKSLVSVIIPVFNEQAVILDCLDSLSRQSYKNMEVIIVDDGSKDKTMSLLESNQLSFPLRIFKRDHLGPGVARNLGARNAKGEILVFVDADMIFDENFIEKLTEPIIEGREIGTFSKDEYVLNKKNVWSNCWNLNKGLPIDRMHPESYPDNQKVFRAILKSEFLKAGGFTPIGYIDDYTISEKLGMEAKASPGAILYHKNPDNLKEVFSQARWVGKSEFKRRKLKNENLMRMAVIIRYSFPVSLVNGLLNSLKYKLPKFLIFKIVYDLAVEVSIIKSFFGEQQYK